MVSSCESVQRAAVDVGYFEDMMMASKYPYYESRR